MEEEPTTTHVIRFVCVRPVRDEVICAITVDDDELIIEQAYTFPLHPRALDTGVIDQSKQNSSAAGGFGDGFKTAAIAILAMGGEMDWRFEAEGQCISWTFEGELRRAVGVLSSKVLNMRIREAGGTRPESCNASHRMIQRLGCWRGQGLPWHRDAPPAGLLAARPLAHALAVRGCCPVLVEYRSWQGPTCEVLLLPGRCDPATADRGCPTARTTRRAA